MRPWRIGDYVEAPLNRLSDVYWVRGEVVAIYPAVGGCYVTVKFTQPAFGIIERDFYEGDAAYIFGEGRGLRLRRLSILEHIADAAAE